MVTRILLLAVGLATVSCAPSRRSAPLTPLPQTRLGAAEMFGPGIVAASGRSVEFELTRAAHVILLHVSADGVEPIAPLHTRDRTHFGAGGHWIIRPPAAAAPTAPAVRPSLADDYQWCKVRTEIVALRTAQPELRDSLGRVLVPASAPGVPGVGASLRCMYGGTGQPWYSRAAAARAPGRGQRETARAYWLLIVSDVKTGAADVWRRTAQLAVDEDDVASALATIPDAVVGGRTKHWAAYYIPVAQ